MQELELRDQYLSRVWYLKVQYARIKVQNIQKFTKFINRMWRNDSADVME